MEPGRELFERYLQSVRKYLPWKGQDDILTELRANLEAQIEEREQELRRPLTEGEMLDWVKQLGSPMQVAGRYRPLQYLIGPALFPLYFYVLRIALLWASAVYAIVSLILILTQAAGGPQSATSSAQGVAEALARVPGLLITVAAWVTAVFAAFEFISTRYPSVCPPIPGVSAGWSPSSLPRLEKPHEGGKRPRSYATAVAEVVFGYIFLVWLLLIPRYPFLMMGPGIYALRATPYRLSPVWMEFYWIVVALNVVQLASNSFALWRDLWNASRSLVHLISKAFALTAFSVLLLARDHSYLVLRQPQADTPQYGPKLLEINVGIWHALQLVCVIVAVQMLWEIAKMGTKGYRARRTAKPMNPSRQNGY